MNKSLAGKFLSNQLNSNDLKKRVEKLEKSNSKFNLILKQAIFEIRKLKSNNMILPNSSSNDIKNTEKNSSDNKSIDKLTESLNLILKELRTIKQTERFWSYIPCFSF